jgi:hypothetical protein
MLTTVRFWTVPFIRSIQSISVHPVLKFKDNNLGQSEDVQSRVRNMHFGVLLFILGNFGLEIGALVSNSFWTLSQSNAHRVRGCARSKMFTRSITLRITAAKPQHIVTRMQWLYKTQLAITWLVTTLYRSQIHISIVHGLHQSSLGSRTVPVPQSQQLSIAWLCQKVKVMLRLMVSQPVYRGAKPYFWPKIRFLLLSGSYGFVSRLVLLIIFRHGQKTPLLCFCTIAAFVSKGLRVYCLIKLLPREHAYFRSCFFVAAVEY